MSEQQRNTPEGPKLAAGWFEGRSGDTVENDFGGTGTVVRVTPDWVLVDDDEDGERWIHRDKFEDETWRRSVCGADFPDFELARVTAMVDARAAAYVAWRNSLYAAGVEWAPGLWAQYLAQHGISGGAA
jgi:hypothetical protein